MQDERGGGRDFEEGKLLGSTLRARASLCPIDDVIIYVMHYGLYNYNVCNANKYISAPTSINWNLCSTNMSMNRSGIAFAPRSHLRVLVLDQPPAAALDLWFRKKALELVVAQHNHPYH